MLWREKEGELGRAIVAISEFDTPRERERAKLCMHSISLLPDRLSLELYSN